MADLLIDKNKSRGIVVSSVVFRAVLIKSDCVNPAILLLLCRGINLLRDDLSSTNFFR